LVLVKMLEEELQKLDQKKFFGRLKMNMNDILIGLSNFIKVAPSLTIKYIIHTNIVFNLLLIIDHQFS